MNSIQMHKFCSREVDRIIDRMHDLCEEGRSKDAEALYMEIQGWILEKDDLEVMSLEYLSMG